MDLFLKNMRRWAEPLRVSEARPCFSREFGEPLLNPDAQSNQETTSLKNETQLLATDNFKTCKILNYWSHTPVHRGTEFSSLRRPVFGEVRGHLATIGVD